MDATPIQPTQAEIDEAKTIWSHFPFRRCFVLVHETRSEPTQFRMHHSKPRASKHTHGFLMWELKKG